MQVTNADGAGIGVFVLVGKEDNHRRRPQLVALKRDKDRIFYAKRVAEKK